MTMPHIAAHVSFEANDDPRAHLGMRLYRVLPSGFVRIGGNRRAGVPEFARGQVCERVVLAPIQDLKANQMQVDGMGVVRWIDDAPDLYRIQHRLFAYRMMPR